MPDSRRTCERMPFKGAVKVHAPTPLDGTGVDLGAGGVGVRVPRALPTGSAVGVELFGDGQPVSGTVRQASPLDSGGIRLGIQFDERNGAVVAKWQAMASY